MSDKCDFGEMVGALTAAGLEPIVLDKEKDLQAYMSDQDFDTFRSATPSTSEAGAADEPFGPDYDYGTDEDVYPESAPFADPGGRSALRQATKRNPRRHPCPTCGAVDVLTDVDKHLGYQCDRCADTSERR